MKGLTRCKEKDELEITVRWKELEWGLTKKGREMFPIIATSEEVETPTESSGDHS
jgi:hypothetical protein